MSKLNISHDFLLNEVHGAYFSRQDLSYLDDFRRDLAKWLYIVKSKIPHNYADKIYGMFVAYYIIQQLEVFQKSRENVVPYSIIEIIKNSALKIAKEMAPTFFIGDKEAIFNLFFQELLYKENSIEISNSFINQLENRPDIELEAGNKYEINSEEDINVKNLSIPFSRYYLSNWNENHQKLLMFFYKNGYNTDGYLYLFSFIKPSDRCAILENLISMFSYNEILIDKICMAYSKDGKVFLATQFLDFLAKNNYISNLYRSQIQSKLEIINYSPVSINDCKMQLEKRLKISHNEKEIELIGILMDFINSY
jgi:hypothetical protein